MVSLGHNKLIHRWSIINLHEFTQRNTSYISMLLQYPIYKARLIATWVASSLPVSTLNFIWKKQNNSNGIWYVKCSINDTREIYWQKNRHTYVIHMYIQWSAVITRSRFSRQYILHCDNSGRKWMSYWNHNRNPISLPPGRAMGYLLWGFGRKKLTAL